MAISREKKASILEELKKIVKNSVSLVFINFKNLSVGESREVRKALKEKEVGFLVAKKTLTKKALTEGGFTGTIPEIVGETALVYGSDLLDPAREIYSFQKKLDKKISIVGGVFEGRFMNQSEMISVASIPPLKTLQAQFVNIINSPIAGFVMALDQIAKKKQ
jgi:large subunit ribosomal protein L10